MVELAWQLELRDHYHMQLSDSNQHQCLVYILSLFYQLAMAGRKDLTHDWRYALKKLAEDNRRDVREIVPNPKRNQNLHLDIYDAMKKRIITASRTPISQQPKPSSFTRHEARQEQPDYDAPFALPEAEDESRPRGQATADIEEQEADEVYEDDGEMPPEEDGGMFIDSSDEGEAMQVEPSPAQAEANAVKEWNDFTRCPGVYEADKDDEVVSREKRDRVSRRDNWCPVSVRGHVQEYRYILHRDEPGAPQKAGVRIEAAFFEMFEFSGHQLRIPDNWTLPDKFHQGRLNRLTGMLRGHSRAKALPRELEDGWIDIDEFARAVLADMPALRHISMNGHHHYGSHGQQGSL